MLAFRLSKNCSRRRISRVSKALNSSGLSHLSVTHGLMQRNGRGVPFGPPQHCWRRQIHAEMTLPRSDAQKSTIYALSTPPGRGGVGIIRISGPEVLKEVWGRMVKPYGNSTFQTPVVFNSTSPFTDRQERRRADSMEAPTLPHRSPPNRRDNRRRPRRLLPRSQILHVRGHHRTPHPLWPRNHICSTLFSFSITFPAACGPRGIYSARFSLGTA